MGDIYDEIVAAAAGSSQASSAPSGDIYDQIALAASTLPPESPTVGSNALNMLSDLPGNLWQGVKKAPSTIYDMASSIPDGISNLAHAPMDAAQIGADAVKLGYSKLTGNQFIPTGTQEGSKEVYGRAERTLRGLGLLGVTAASGGLGAVASPLVTTAAAPTLFNKVNQLVGNDEQTTAEQDIRNFEENLGTNATLIGGAKVATEGAKALPEIGKAIDRSSLGTRQSDYGRASELQTIMTPEGVPESYVKGQLDSLLESGKLGSSRDPAKLTKIVDKEMRDLTTKIDTRIKAYDDLGVEAPHPSFDNAIQYIYDGKVPANEIPNYLKRLDELDQGIAGNGQGKLSFLQQQKIAVGKNYSTVDAVKAGFERQIYKDLQGTIEKVAPEVGELNAELGKFMVAKPAINRSLLAKENASLAKKIGDIGFTTGGIGAAVGTGALLGNVPGAVLGAGVGLAGKLLRSNYGQGRVAAGIRGITKAGNELGAITPDALIPPEWAVKAGVGASSQRVQDQEQAKKEAIKAAVLAKYPEMADLFVDDQIEPRKLSSKNAGKTQTSKQGQQLESKQGLLNKVSAPSLNSETSPESSQDEFSGLLGIDEPNTQNGSLFSLKNASLFDVGADMDAPQAEVRGVEDMAVNPIVSQFEGGQKLKAYSPPAKGSGITIATGIDLGQRSTTELKDLGLSSDLIQKVEPYLGKKDAEASSFLSKNPLKLSKQEADQLDSAIGEKISSTLSAKYTKATGEDINSIPEEARTVLESLAYNFGPDLETKLPSLWQHVVNNDWQGLHDFLITTKWKQPELSKRRYQEAALLSPLLDQVEA